MNIATRKNAPGESTMRPFGTYQPPAVTAFMTGKPSNVPEPKSSRTMPT
jgi:hypothetical protein